MPAPSASVDWDALLQVAWVSLVAGVGVTVGFAVAIYGATRGLDLSRSGRLAAAGPFMAIALIALVAVAVAVVLGIVAMTDE